MTGIRLHHSASIQSLTSTQMKAVADCGRSDAPASKARVIEVRFITLSTVAGEFKMGGLEEIHVDRDGA